jgi:hypothetical protein
MSQAPWWFAAATSLLGVPLGIFLKWAIDRSSETRRQHREDRLRFLNERRETYAHFAQAAHSVANQKGTYHLIEKEKVALDRLIEETTQRLEVVDPESTTYKDLLTRAEALHTQKAELLQEMADNAGLVAQRINEFIIQRMTLELVAPDNVRNVASKVRTDNDDGSNDTLLAFLEAARHDIASNHGDRPALNAKRQPT